MDKSLNYMLSNLSDHKLLAIYLCPEEPQVFLVGSVLSRQAESFICLKTISQEGNCDGFMICNPAYIYRYEVENSYLRELARKATQSENAFPPVRGWNDFLVFAVQQHAAVQLIGRNGKRTARGILCSYSDRSITLQRVLKSGADGKSCRFSLSGLAGIACDIMGGSL